MSTKRSSQFTGSTTVLKFESVCLSAVQINLKAIYIHGEVEQSHPMKIQFLLIWQTLKMESFFKPKDRNAYPGGLHTSFINRFVVGQEHIGETTRNYEVHVDSHNDINKQTRIITSLTYQRTPRSRITMGRFGHRSSMAETKHHKSVLHHTFSSHVSRSNTPSFQSSFYSYDDLDDRKRLGEKNTICYHIFFY